MVLRPKLHRALLVFALFITASAAFATYQLRQVGQALAEFDYEPLPASAAAHAEPEPFKTEPPQWTWSPEPTLHQSSCDGEWKAGCEPARRCDGVTTSVSTRRLDDDERGPRSELTIGRVQGLGFETAETCTTEMRTGEVRFQLEDDVVTVFSRSPESLITWQYDFDCNLVETRVLPADLLSVTSAELQPLPLMPRRTVSGRGLYFETLPLGGDCETTCSLRIHEAPYDARRSEHDLVAPREIKTGATADYIWWTYWNADSWFVRVIDRRTHVTLLEDSGEHQRDVSPIVGVRFIDDRFTVNLVSFPSVDIVQHHLRVYELPTGEVIAEERTNWGIPSKEW